MISYKRDVLERQSLSEVKMGRGSPICERVCKKIVEYFKNNVPQRQIAKALQISSSTVHNIIKRFRETGEISVRKGQGCRAKEEGDLPACYQRSVQKPASLMVWGCISAYGMGSFHVLEGTICSPPDDVCFREGLVYFSRTMQNHILQLLQQHGFVVEESGCWIDLPAVQIFRL